jgi:hypothetical protein
MSKRELVLLILVIFIAVGAAYYLLFYMPISNERAELESEIFFKQGLIDDAEINLLRFAAQSSLLQAGVNSLQQIAANIPAGFDYAGLIEHVKDIFPANAGVLIHFPPPDNRAASFASAPSGDGETVAATAVRSMELRFTADYNMMKDIIYQLMVFEEAESRVISLSYNAGAGGSSDVLSVTLQADYLELRDLFTGAERQD